MVSLVFVFRVRLPGVKFSSYRPFTDKLPLCVEKYKIHSGKMG